MPKKKGGKKSQTVPEEWPLGASKDSQLVTGRSQLEAKFNSLQEEFIERSQHLQEARSEARDTEAAFHELKAKHTAAREKRAAIEKDFTRQFKANQETLVGKVSELEAQAGDLRAKIRVVEDRTDRIAREKDLRIAELDKRIDELKRTMRQQTNEFDEMLQQILDSVMTQMEVNPNIEAALEDTELPMLEHTH